MSGSKLAHMVYFTLHDASPEKVQALLSDMHQYLDDHPGLDYFACGTLNPDLSRPVNDRQFDVSLHTVFTDRAAHDAYQSDPRHTEFIQRNKQNWQTVRVFDSDCN
ncbi:MAG: Dabb family protein [Pirellulaceae bacterium]|nr:Dabb family protein [Pirellulaceae bacterium]